MPKTVLVTGDVTIDWNLARTRRADGGGAFWNADDCTRAYWQRGGAALLADLIQAVAIELRRTGQADFAVRQMAAPRDAVVPGDDRYHHSYAMWSLFKYGVHPPLDAEKPAWRVEEFLGLDRSVTDGSSAPAEWKRVADDTPDADLVVVDDADLGFRSQRKLCLLLFSSTVTTSTVTNRSIRLSVPIAWLQWTCLQWTVRASHKSVLDASTPLMRVDRW